MDELMKIDVYELLDVSASADEKEVKKAYRKKALSCHPDKNPDNPKAAELFQQLSKALEVLTDPAARAAYDKVLNARKAAQIRHRELDSKRKKLKEDLEAREKYVQDVLEPDAQLKKEIERLRKEGSRHLEEVQRLMREEIEKERLNFNKRCDPQISVPRLKVKWKTHKKDENNGGYDQENLETIFKKYGHSTCLVSTKKNGSAIVEFASPEAAQQAFKNEKGRKENPLTLSWISGQPDISDSVNNDTTSQSIPEFANSTLTSRDYESLVLMKLRQAEERKKLIQQMQDDD